MRWKMNVGLFIPCYVNQFYPSVAVATLQILERLGADVNYPLDQTCCGQPMANAGFEHLTADCSRNFIRQFSGYDYIVSPSGSCTLHIKEHLPDSGIRHRVFELTEFLTDVVKVTKLSSSFPYKVGVHHSCHGQRGLKLAQMSELVAAQFSKTTQLLKMVAGVEIVSLDRADECCGFGGTFCVTEEAVSVKMGKDRINDHMRHGVEVITGSDMSCLMHLDGILRRSKSPLKTMHIAEILNAQK
jgi:L-lactate dehydrogenase complex protein LldE